MLLAGIVAATVLTESLIYKNREISPESQFKNSAYHYLVGEFTEGGFHNLQSPLFDFNDPSIRDVYDKVKKTVEAKVIPRDIQSNNDIVNALKKHLSNYGNRSLIIISGAGCHIWGATPKLKDRFDAGYISITQKKLDLGDVIGQSIYFRDETGNNKVETAKKIVEIQLTRDLGVVRHMGYRTIEDYMRDISDFDGTKNIVVGIEETGLHPQYHNKTKLIYQILSAFIEGFKPNSILYIGEGLFSESMKREFEKGQGTKFMGKHEYRELFLIKAKKLKIPVEFASFGRDDTDSFFKIIVRQPGELSDSLSLFQYIMN